MKIYIGADHRGFELKKELKKFLIEKGYEVEDAGAFKYDKDDDYPDFAEAVAEKVSKDDSARGILLCGSGTGMDAAANKVRGVRATLAFSKEITRAARNDDDVNVISLPADFLKSQEAEEENIRPVVLRRWEKISRDLDRGRGRSFDSAKEVKKWLKHLGK